MPSILRHFSWGAGGHRRRLRAVLPATHAIHVYTIAAGAFLSTRCAKKSCLLRAPEALGRYRRFRILAVPSAGEAARSTPEDAKLLDASLPMRAFAWTQKNLRSAHFCAKRERLRSLYQG